MATPRAPHEHGRIRRPSPLSECGSAVTLTENLPEARPQLLGLPRHQARRPRPAHHSIPARPRPNSLQASLTASGLPTLRFTRGLRTAILIPSNQLWMILSN